MLPAKRGCSGDKHVVSRQPVGPIRRRVALGGAVRPGDAQRFLQSCDGARAYVLANPPTVCWKRCAYRTSSLSAHSTNLERSFHGKVNTQSMSS